MVSGPTMPSPATQQPTPQFFQTINSYQRTEAMKAAIELEVFTAIGEGNSAVPEIAKWCQTSERDKKFSDIQSFVRGKGTALSALSNYPMELPMLLIPQRHTAATTHDRTASS
jgi:hypothetical protein